MLRAGRMGLGMIPCSIFRGFRRPSLNSVRGKSRNTATGEPRFDSFSNGARSNFPKTTSNLPA